MNETEHKNQTEPLHHTIDNNHNVQIIQISQKKDQMLLNQSHLQNHILEEAQRNIQFRNQFDSQVLEIPVEMNQNKEAQNEINMLLEEEHKLNQRMKELEFAEKQEHQKLQANNNIIGINLQGIRTERSEVQDSQQQRKQKIQLDKMKKSKLISIEQQKLKIQEELMNLESEMKALKEQELKDSKQQIRKNKNFKKLQQISQDPVAYENAQKLIAKLNHEKKALKQKKLKDQQKILQSMQRQTLQKNMKRQQQLQAIKQQKRQQIAKRLLQEKKKRQERRLIDQQSNILIKEIKKEEKLREKPSSTSLEIVELEKRKKILQKKRNFDVADIEQHQKRYQKYLKEKSKLNEIHRTEDIIHNSIKYPKGMFFQKLQQEEKQRKELEKLKQQQKKNQLQKRIKYGELVKNLFLPPKHIRLDSIEKNNYNKQISSEKQKPPTPEIRVNERIKNNVSIKTYKEKIYKQKETLPIIKKYDDGKSEDAMIQNQFMAKEQKMKQQERRKKEQEQLRINREKQREKEIRRQTNERLKNMQSKDIELKRNTSSLPKVKYQNYLNKIPRQKQNNDEWKKIISNQNLSKQQKYKQLINKANMMQNKAKFKEQMNNNQQNEDAMNLYIASIQAKLALLNKF